MFPRGVITPASPAAANEARALLAPEEERLLESNASTKRSGALTWTLRGLGAVAVVSGVVAVAAIAPGGRDATAAVLARLGGPATVLGRAPAVATVRPEPLPKDAQDEYARKHAHEAKYRSASARARVPTKRSSDDAADTSKTDPVEEVDPSDADVVPDAGASDKHPARVKRLSYANPQVQHMTEEMRAKDAEIEALKFQLRRQAEELDARREASGEIDSPTPASSKEEEKASSASSERRHRSSRSSRSSEKKAKAVDAAEETSTGAISSAAHHLGGGEPEDIPERTRAEDIPEETPDEETPDEETPDEETPEDVPERTRERSPPEETPEETPEDADYDPTTGGEGPPLDDPSQALENCEDVCEGHDFTEAVCVSKQGCEWDDGQCWSEVGPNPCDFVEPEAHAHENCELVCEGHNYGLKECVAIRGCEYDGGACWSAVGPHPCDSGPDPIEFPDDASGAWAANKPWGDAYGNKWGETYGPKTDDDAGVFEPVADAAEAVTEGVENAAEAVGDGVEAAGEAVSDGAEAAGEAVTDGAEAIGDGIEDVGEGISNILPHFGDDEPGSKKASSKKASKVRGSEATGKLGKDEKAKGPYVASAATKYTDGSLENGAVDSAYVPVPTEADVAVEGEAEKTPYVASATKLTDGTFDGAVDSVYPKVPTEADVPDENAKGPYVAASTKFSDGTFDGPDQFDPTGVYPTGGYEKSPEEIETEAARVEARASEAGAYKKAYAAAAIEEEAVGDEHTDVAEEDTGYRGGYVAASTKLTDGTYSAALGKHHKYTAAPTVNPYGVKDAEESAAADAEEVQEADDELESEADAYKKAYAAADAEEQAAGDEHADAADDDGYRGGYVAASTRLTDGTYSESALGKHHKSAAAAEEDEDEKPKGYQSSYTINPYGVKDPEETTELDEKEEDVPVEKPHGYVASSTRLTDGSMHTTDDVAAMGSQGVVASAAASDDVDWANFQPEPTNYHDEPADDEELELVRKQEAERAAEFEDKEEKERLEAAEKAMSWTAYQSENGKIDHALEAAEEEAADAAVVDDAASEAESSADEDAEAAAAEERYESVAAEEESASASAYASSSSVPSEDAEQEKKHGYRAPATHLTDGSASAADPAPGAPAPHGYVAAATRLTNGSGNKARPQDQPGYVAPHGYVAAGGRAEANNVQKEAYAVDDAEEQEAPSGYVAAGGGRL